MATDISFEKDTNRIPIPDGGNVKGIAEAIRSLEVGESFVSDCRASSILVTAKRLGVRLTQRKLEDGRLRWWRVE